jgi:hypothetical protein
MQAHIISSVVVDIAAFKVCHSVGIDRDATALRAARARSSYIHRGNRGNVWEGSKCKHSHPVTSTCTATGQFKGQFKRASTHVACGVVMDIAAFKVSHSVGTDEDATALPAARARSSSIHRGKHTLSALLSWILQPSKLATPVTKTPPPCEPRERGQAPSTGAMEESSGRV